jgi:hypothetical protein
VYFKGKWEQSFSTSATQNASFHRLGGADTVDVPFMQSWEEQFIAVQDDFKVLQLWYKKPKKPAPFFPNRAPLVNPYAAPSSQIPLIFRQGRRP